MSDARRYEAEDGDRWRAPEVVARLAGPVFVDMRPGHVLATCAGVTGVGPNRAAAFQELAARAAPGGRRADR